VPLYSSEALILRTYKLGEADRIVVFLSRDRGKKRGVAKGARRARSRFLGALEPLTRVNVAYFERERRDLVSLNYAEAVRSPLQTASGNGLAYVGYFAELLDEWSPEGDPGERLYRLGTSMLDAFASRVPLPVLARYFEYWLLKLQGVYPALDACGSCRTALADRGAVIAARASAVLCVECGRDAGGVRMSPAALAFLRAAGPLAPGALAAVPFEPHVARELEAAHRALIAHHLDREPRSVRVLRDIG